MNIVSFPLGIAKGDYFCHRLNETNHLIKNIHQPLHTVLIAPRRYGKTSLAYKAIQKSKLPYAQIDLFMTTNAAEITQSILAGIDNVLSQLSNAENLLSIIKSLVKTLRPSFEAGVSGLTLKLEPQLREPNNAAHLCEGLQILDRVLQKKSTRAVLLIDEFQEIQRIAPDQGIEGAIRHVAQETKNFTIIFSGSHRHLLQNMFNDKSKPLYRLCDEIHLDRMHEKDYIPFLNKFAHKKWGVSLPTSVINKILASSESHPYYFNAICEKIFQNEKLPTEITVNEVWDNLMVLKKKDILTETRNLEITHKKLLVAIAHGINSELTGRKFLNHAELSGSSVIRALEYLENNDFIEKVNDKYQLIDPLLKYVICKLTFF